MYGSFDISGSGLEAQRVRLDAISSNLANQDTPEFKKIAVQFAQGDPGSGNPLGVHVEGIRRIDSFIPSFEPDNPKARADGNVYYPDIDYTEMMVDAIEALRAYEANIQAVEATRSMIDSALRVIA